MWKNTTLVADQRTFNKFTNVGYSRVNISHYRTRNATAYEQDEIRKLFYWTAIQKMINAPQYGLDHSQVYVTITAFPRDTIPANIDTDETARYVSQWCDSVKRDYKDNETTTTSIRIYNTTGATNLATEWLETFKPFIADKADELPDWTLPLTTSVNTGATVYKVKGANCYVLFAHGMNDLFFNRLSALICINTQARGIRITDDELRNNLAATIAEADAPGFVNILAPLYKKVLAEQEQKEKERMFKDVEEREKTIYLQPVKQNLERARQRINEYEQHLIQEYAKQRELQLKLVGLQNSDTGTPLVAALKTMPKVIEYIRIHDSQLDCAVTTPLTFFESDKFKRIFGSVLAHQQIDNVANLLKAVMYDKTIRLTMTEYFTLMLNSGEVQYRTISEQLGDESSKIKGIPNPHHCYYNCWGDNKSPISKAIGSGDLVGAIMQAVSAVGSINVLDSPVMEKFVLNFGRASAYKTPPEAVTILKTNETMSIEAALNNWTQIAETIEFKEEF